jgi:hypothetical protein
MRVVRGFNRRQVAGAPERSDTRQETDKVAARHSVGTTFALPRDRASNPQLPNHACEFIRLTQGFPWMTFYHDGLFSLQERRDRFEIELQFSLSSFCQSRLGEIRETDEQAVFPTLASRKFNSV